MTWVRETRKHQRVHHASRREGRLSTATKHHGTLCKEEEEFASWETREEDGVGEKSGCCLWWLGVWVKNIQV